jgi:hypothetical protein
VIGTVFEKTRQPPSKLVMLLRGVAKGEPTARLALELGIGRVRLLKARQQIQQQLRQRLLHPGKAHKASTLSHQKNRS